MALLQGVPDTIKFLAECEDNENQLIFFVKLELILLYRINVWAMIRAFCI